MADTVAVVPIYGRRDTGAFSQCERVADFIVFDHSTKTYTIVGKIKCDDGEAEQQNIEQRFTSSLGR